MIGKPMNKKNTKDPRAPRAPRVSGFKKNCIFCKKEVDIDYKNLELLARYISGKGRVVSRRISGNCAKHQRKITEQVKHARYLGLVGTGAR